MRDAGALPQSPFLDDHAALPVDLLRVERHRTGEVGQRQQSLVDQPWLVGRDLEHVDRLVEARIRVDVRTEAGPCQLEVRHELARLEMRGAVERHVLEHVRQPALVIVFEHRAGLDRQAQQDALLRSGVPADVVGEAVRQPADGDRLVHGQDAVERRQRLLGLRCALPRRWGRPRGEEKGENGHEPRPGADGAAEEGHTIHDS